LPEEIGGRRIMRDVNMKVVRGIGAAPIGIRSRPI
jgi:hypothetical protein